MERFQRRRLQRPWLVRSPLRTFDPAASVEPANQRPPRAQPSRFHANRGGRAPGPHRPSDRSPAALPADARPPGCCGARPTAQPGVLSRKARRARRTEPHRAAPHRTAPLAPLWSASPGRADSGLLTVAALKGTVPQEPVPPTATNPSRQRLLRGPLPRTLARESDAEPSGCGRGALLAGPRARLAPFPHLLLQDACPAGSRPWAAAGRTTS